MTGPFFFRRRIAMPRLGKCRVEMVLGKLDLIGQCPKQGCDPRCCLEGRFVVAGEDAGLQLAIPIPGRGDGQPGVVRQILLEVSLAKFRIIERVEVRRLSTERSNKSELRDDDIADETEPRAPHEVERALRLSFRFTQRLSSGQEIGNEGGAGVGGKGEVTGIPGRLEGPSQKEAAVRPMLRPMGDVEREDRIDPTTNTVEPTLLGKLQAKPAQAGTSPRSAEIDRKDATEQRIGQA